jgi:hypothetical protein
MRGALLPVKKDLPRQKKKKILPLSRPLRGQLYERKSKKFTKRITGGVWYYTKRDKKMKKKPDRA